MPDDLFPDLHSRLGVTRRPDRESGLERAYRRELADREERASRRKHHIDLSSFEFKSESRRRAKRATERRAKADRGLIEKLLSGLLLGKIIGLNLDDNDFADLWEGFQIALSEILPAQHPAAPTLRSSDRSLVARGMGVSPHTANKMVPATPRSRVKYDAFAAELACVPDLKSAIDAGDLDKFSPRLTRSFTALLGNVRSASRSNDRAALMRAGEGLGVLSAALRATATTTDREYQRRAKASGAPMVEVSPGVFVDFTEAERGPDGKPRLKASRGGPEIRRRLRSPKIRKS